MMLDQVRALHKSFKDADAPPTLDLFSALSKIHTMYLNAVKRYPEDKLPANLEEARLELESMLEQVNRQQDETRKATH